MRTHRQVTSVSTVEMIGGAARAYRESLGYTQRQAALVLGVTQRWLSGVERGLPKVLDARYVHILAILGVELQVVHLIQGAPDNNQ